MSDLLERLKSALADRYAVESEIGRGGMATVYLAEDLKHHRKVAIKVLHPELAASVGPDRFLREIETVAGLTHPHVLPLHDSGEADGLLYFVMPYVKGENLRQRLEREKQLPVDEAIRIAQEVAGALDHAHREGVVHRDIKPANILLEEGHAVVADFGVARAVSAAGSESVTATGMAVGTPAYMSPEQAGGEEVDERSDLYALGCILYEMLAGEPPLVGPTPQATAAKRLANRPTPLGAIRTTVPANLASLVERALAPTAADRPATARKLAEELEEVRRSPEPAARRSPAARWLLPVIGLAAVLAVVVAVVSMLTTDRSVTRDVRLLPVGADLGEQSIAVLPFANNTGDGDRDLGIGLARLLNSALAQREHMRVVAVEHVLDLVRQAGLEETDHVPDDLAVSIASASGARSMVSGVIGTVGGELRLDAQLADLSDGTIISAAQAHGADVYALVNEVAARLLAAVLEEVITPTELMPIAQLATTGNFDAYREYQAGLLAERRFQRDSSVAHYQRAVELDSTFALAWLRLGMRALFDQRDREATSYLERSERFAVDAPERDRLFIQALLARVARRWDDYLSHLEELVARYPDDREGRMYLGTTYQSRDRLDDSRRVLEEGLELDPYWLGALNNLIYVVAAAGDEVAADSLSLRRVELNPELPNAYDTRGEILEQFGRIEEAREMYREAIRLGEPGWIQPYANLFDTYMSDGDPAGARTALEPFLDSNDPDVAATIRLMIADTYVPEGRYLDATEVVRSALRKADELGSDNWRHRILAEVAGYANATGAWEEAEEAFLELLRIEARVDIAMFQLLSIYGKQGRFDEMSEVRDGVAANIDAAPDFLRGRTEGLLYVADGLIAWYRDGDAEETVRLFGEGRAAAGISEATFLDGTELGSEEVFALIQVGRVSDALGIIDAQERMVTERGWPQIIAHAAWYLRGRAYEALGEPEQALQSYQQLLDVAGNGIREVVLFRDTPERVARLKGEP